MRGLLTPHFSAGICQSHKDSHGQGSLAVPLLCLVHEPAPHEWLMSCVPRCSTSTRLTTCFQWLFPCAIDSSPCDSVLAWHHFSTVSAYLCHFASSFFLLIACTFVFYLSLLPPSLMPDLIPCSFSHSTVSTLSPALPVCSKQAFLACSLPSVLLILGTVSHLITTSAFPWFPTQTSLLYSCFSSSFST